MSEVRGVGRECQAATAQEQLIGATPHMKSGAAGGRSDPLPKSRGSGREELSHARGQGWRPRLATPRQRSGGCAGAGKHRGVTPHSRSGGSGGKEIPLVQGKEQQLCFAGAAVKRYPTSKERDPR